MSNCGHTITDVKHVFGFILSYAPSMVEVLKLGTLAPAQLSCDKGSASTLRKMQFIQGFLGRAMLSESLQIW
ncbi:hypothetical protein IFM89_038664 [Coptis chinensis]|uniref:Uncharacterized protein n=1 Tax=Coptis chinensis TaxID=261450 RepID=A0A835I8S4_9MAGN|nr:hypothetical protein IFM89_038664 [Coptis chinensis]